MKLSIAATLLAGALIASSFSIRSVCSSVLRTKEYLPSGELPRNSHFLSWIGYTDPGVRVDPIL